MMAVANFDMEFPDSSDAGEGHGDYLESAEPPPAKLNPKCDRLFQMATRGVRASRDNSIIADCPLVMAPSSK